MPWNPLTALSRRSARRPQPRFYRLAVCELEDRVTPTAPATPVVTEPFAEGQITGTFDLNMQTDPAQYFDADGDAWQATDWLLRDAASGQAVWQLPFTSAPPLTFYRVDFSDGTFVGPLAGRTELNYSTDYQLVVRYRDAAGEVSAPAVRTFRTAAATQPVPGAGLWLARPGYVVEPVQTGLRLPVNIAFVPNPGPNPADPLYYVTELYGSVRVVRRDGTMQTFATNLLDYNPQGPISGTGEQGLTGLAVERDSANPNVYHLYVGMLWDNGSPAGPPNHYPKVERLTSAAGGLAIATRTVLLNMQPETQGQSHIISNITIGPDNKLYVHMGDGFNAATALNLDLYRGKLLRMNKDGTPVATGDPAGANPFYSAANGINARDYVYAYGFRNPFGGAWRPGTNEHWVAENGNSLDRLVKVASGASYGWAGSDAALIAASDYVWNPSTAPVNIEFVAASRFGGSGFPAEEYGHAFVSLSGSTYAAGTLQRSKGIVGFPDLDTYLPPVGTNSPKLAAQPSFLVKYNGTGRASVAALAAGPDGLYFSDLYEDTGAGGATAAGANVYRVRYVGTAGGQVPTVATPAAAAPNPVATGLTTALSVLGADDGGEPALRYTWGVLGNPPAPVSFSANGTNAARNTVATFAANGTYNLYVAVRDVGGQAVISSVTVNVTSVPTGTGNGLRGVYYDNIDFTGATVTRTDPVVDFNWGAGSPAAGIGADTFSVRWTGYVLPRYTETYTFHTTTDDGVRLYVNNQLVVNQFVDQGATTWSGTVPLTAGRYYPVRLEYYDNTGGAVARLEWQSATQARQVVPQAQLYSPVAAPAAPTGLAATPFSGTRIDLTWADAAGPPNFADTFLVERSLTGTSAWFQTAVVTGTAYPVTGLTPGTRYYFRVRASNSAGDSAYSPVASAVTATQGDTVSYPADFSTHPAGGALTFVGGAAIVNNAVRLTSGAANQNRAVYATAAQNVAAFTTTFTYTKAGGADGATFVIHRDPRGLAALGGGGTGGGGSLAYGPTNSITPSFALAFNFYNGHPYGTEFLTNGVVTFNYTQTNINVSLDNTPITVTITYHGGRTLTATLTQGANTETKTFTFASTLPALLGGSTAFVGFTAATGGTTSTQAVTNWTYAPLVPPGATTGLQAQLTGYTAASTAAVPLGARLTWSPAAGASGYKIERKLTAGGTYAQVGTAAGTAFDDTGLAPQSAYFYRVRATNLVGDGAYSAELQVNTPAPPAVPTDGLATAVTTAAVALRWTDAAGTEDGYQIFRSVNQGPFALLVALPPDADPAPSFSAYSDTGLTPGTRYDYRIQAFNLAGSAGFVTVSTAALTLAPTGVIAAAGPNQVRLTWSPTPGATGYNVYRGTTPGGQAAAPVGTVSGLVVFTDTGLANGTTYYYRVTAVNLGGESARSAEVSATPHAAPRVAAVAVNGGAAQRSRVTSLAVTFDTLVTIAAGAFTLTRVGMPSGAEGDNATIGTVVAGTQAVNGVTVATLTFAGATTTAGSLNDGDWLLAIDRTRVASAVGAVPMADDFTRQGVRRLFGDINGDGSVDGSDLAEFARAFGLSAGDAGYVAAFDLNGDGTINGDDQTEFASRYGLPL